MDALRKVYIEPTNGCNLHCRTCMRNVWDEPIGFMEWETYQALIEELAGFDTAQTVAFAGIGEPLLHPRFVDMVRLAKEHHLRVELTTNALLLTREVAGALLELGLDQLVVSIDGTTAETFGQVRRGGSLSKVVENLRAFYELSEPSPLPPLTIGIEFVAMRSNIRELPHLYSLAKYIGASLILITNVLPYTEEMVPETLYNLRATSFQGKGSPWTPAWVLPKMDLTEETLEPLLHVFRTQANISYLDLDLGSRNSFCPFVQAGALAVGWHGGVSPCPPLMHSYTCYVMGRRKSIRRWEVGRLPGQSLRAIWEAPAYATFRERVRQFDFPPCVDCGCDLAETNEEDCFGNTFPVCGDCLWARGIIRCA